MMTSCKKKLMLYCRDVQAVPLFSFGLMY